MGHEPTPRTSLSTTRTYGLKGMGILLCLLGSVPNAASAEDAIIAGKVGEVSGRVNSTLTPVATFARNVENGSLGMGGDLGWYLNEQSVDGAQHQLFYSAVKGDRYNDEIWNSAARGYDNSRFGESSVSPYVITGLGGIHGVGISGEGFALSSKFHIGHYNYHWFFKKSYSTHKHLDHGPGGYMVGLGYNF